MGSTSSQSASSVQSEQCSYYGEYKCGNCGRYWSSTLSWPDAYQKCKRCKSVVYPFKQREVMLEDRQRDSSSGHPQELCQKCASLGYYCGSHNRSNHYSNINVDHQREPEKSECVIL